MPDTFTTLTEPEFDQRIIENPAGVRVSVLANGCLQWIMVGPTMVNLFVGHPLGGGPMRLLIRKHDGDTVTHVQAVGPDSHAEVAVGENAFLFACGCWFSHRRSRGRCEWFFAAIGQFDFKAINDDVAGISFETELPYMSGEKLIGERGVGRSQWLGLGRGIEIRRWFR